MKYTVTLDGEIFEIEFGPEGRAWVNQRPYEVDLRDVGGQYSLLMDHRSYEIHVTETDGVVGCFTVGGRPYHTVVQRGHGVDRGSDAGLTVDERGARPLRHLPSSIEMRAPLPGLVVEMPVVEGAHVEEQDVVAVLESMKMNLELRAPREGVVCHILVSPGTQVAQDEVMAIISPNGASPQDKGA